MKIIETKKWNKDDIRRLCIRNEYCTKMTNDEYETMLELIETNEPTTSIIYMVANSIVTFSDLSAYGQTRDENVQSIMFELNEATHTFYEIER